MLFVRAAGDFGFQFVVEALKVRVSAAFVRFLNKRLRQSGGVSVQFDQDVLTCLQLHRVLY